MFRKALALDQCELKFATDKPMTFEGYASKWGGVDAYGDTIVRGAYAETIKANPTLPMLFSHSQFRPIGKIVSMVEDEIGLLVKGEFTRGNVDAENVAASVKHGAITALSIGYMVPEGGYTATEKGGRILTRIDLYEISPVVFPADDGARIDLTSVKAGIASLKSIRDWEQFLRDEGGFSRSAAPALLAHLKAFFQGEPGECAELKREIARLEEEKASLYYQVLRYRMANPLN